MHRMDPSTPIEETMQVLKTLISEGKIRYIGLSECTPSELRRAHAIHPVTAVQMEWSLQTRDLEEAVVPTARELGVAIVPYSPLGRGFLADLEIFEKGLPKNDSRANHPRFTGENFEENKKRVAKFQEIAKGKGCTPAQLALTWLHSQGEDVFPIPGTKTASRVEENAKAFSFAAHLSAEDKKEIEGVVQLLGERHIPGNAQTNFNNRL
jgi:aryl-alcohol dehydrogenase-like predicted oxidoreductase